MCVCVREKEFKREWKQEGENESLFNMKPLKTHNRVPSVTCYLTKNVLRHETDIILTKTRKQKYSFFF